MILKQRLHTQICNKILILLFILTIAFVPACANAEAFSYEKQILTTADEYFEKAMNSSEQQEKDKYFQKACERYYMVTQKDPKNSYSYTQIGRIYTLENNKKLAREYLITALNMNPADAKIYYYLGDYYYSVKKYHQAIESYEKAYQNGMNTDSTLNLKMGNIYEKLGDLLKANYYYKKAYLADSKNEDIPDKIRNIEAIKYKNTGYYDLKRN